MTRAGLAGRSIVLAALALLLADPTPARPASPQSAGFQSAGSQSAGFQPAPAVRAWIQLTGRGAEARAVTTDAQCPDAVIDGAPHAMEVRAAPNADFPIIVCQLSLPKTAARVEVVGRSLPLPVARPKRLVIFGDTGCRLKGDQMQPCDDAAAWPFATVARLAAAHHPDLVIHVGDYYYRESACPAGRSGCAGSPWGDNWTTWDADFFTPASPLLSTAPWVMTRGNHEDCARGGPGWFRLLDGAIRVRACPAASDPMVIDLSGLALYVLDSATTSDRTAPFAEVAAFRRQLDALIKTPPTGPAWIVTHRPIWGLVPVARVGPMAPFEVPINATQQAAVRGRDLSAVRMVVSGHIHHFASFSFAGGDRPAQLIVGTGGDVGEPADTPKVLDDQVSLDRMVARRFGFDRYGFLVLDRIGDDWSGDFYDVSDNPIAHCRLAGRALTCRTAARGR